LPLEIVRLLSEPHIPHPQVADFGNIR
jgi:hypothetical protein